MTKEFHDECGDATRATKPGRPGAAMSLDILREDALTTSDLVSGSGFSLRLSLPWIRSLPLASLTNLRIAIDGDDVPDVRVDLGARSVAPERLDAEAGWWFIQDRVVVSGPAPRPLDGAHDVGVSFDLVIPYLQIGPDGPLTLPFRADRPLVADAAASAPTVSRDVAGSPAPDQEDTK